MQTWLPFLVVLSSFVPRGSVVTDAFAVVRLPDSHGLAVRDMRLKASRGFPSDNNKEDGFDLEAVRKHLEALVRGGGDSFELQTADGRLAKVSPRTSYAHSTAVDVAIPPISPLTTIDRVRREKEMELLKRLNQGDAVLSDLWTLWFQERGPKAAAQLLKAEELTAGGPQGYHEAELILLNLVETYGAGWAEPLNRLATLYYMQGRLEDSEKFCKMVLTVKPWHFGALSGIVMVYAGLHDAEKARKWAARRLPTYAPNGPNRRRIAWVRQAELDASASLTDAETRLVEHLGDPDDMNDRLSLGEDVWQ